jgi:hypothetical protein
MYGEPHSTLDTPRYIMGRKIDIIISSLNMNICSGEANNVSRATSIKQESKNVRVNVANTESLSRINSSNHTQPTVMYSDWIGTNGVIAVIS